ncbi:BLUF domain-containing protein [Aquimarina litoralis]|uniref:BLUF domain-containing protein n=1 Tax=Aquimarina litoralis TaxID=584605 RepID=UPI001C55DEC6|nr:BLUF domain-containing protein [Aquimarina litoralis]MBW1293928.1 hypothetical protein [Aquimarina litoralis]
MSQLACVLYLSIENKPFSETSLDLLVSSAQTTNKSHGITGFLYYKQRHFFQYIEGTPDKINDLLDNLKKDTRHKILEFVQDNTLNDRRFPNWDMGDLKTNQLMQIKFEDLIIENLLWKKTYKNTNLPINDANLWKLVDKLAFFRNKGHFS